MAAERDVGFAEDKIRQWGRYAGDPTPEQLTRAIEHLDSASAPTATVIKHASRRCNMSRSTCTGATRSYSPTSSAPANSAHS